MQDAILKPLASLELGKQYMEQGKLDEAIELYQQMIAENDSNLSEAYYRLGEAFDKKERFEDAASCYETAIQLDSTHFWSHYNLGQILAKWEQFDAAISYYHNAIELDPTISWVYHYLGEILTVQGQLEEAITCYQKAIDLNPDYSWSYHFMGEALLKQGQIQDALSYYEKAIDANPTAAYHYFWLGKVLQQTGQQEKAFNCYFKAIELDPILEAPYIELQYFSLPPESANDLINLYRQVIQHQPDFHLVWGNLGDLLTQQGQLDDAIVCYQTSCYEHAIAADSALVQRNWKAKKEKDPNFIIIGFSKCGTTSLYIYLHEHPQVIYGHKKEIEFFTSHFDQGVEWYLSHFPSITDDIDFVTGESTPRYIDFLDVDERLARLFPEVKLIVLLRNPVDRAVSQYYHTVRIGYEYRSIEDVVMSELQQLESATEDSFRYVESWDSSCLAGGLYVYKLQRWMNHFPNEQFLILKSEDFYEKTPAIMQEVCQFLNISEYSFSKFQKHQSGNYPPISSELRDTLTEYFQPHNQKLEKFLGRSFGWSM